MMIPNSRIWVGVIYLDDFSRKQYLQEGNITFDASRLASGTYIYSINNGISTISKKMTLLK